MIFLDQSRRQRLFWLPRMFRSLNRYYYYYGPLSFWRDGQAMGCQRAQT